MPVKPHLDTCPTCGGEYLHTGSRQVQCPSCSYLQKLEYFREYREAKKAKEGKQSKTQLSLLSFEEAAMMGSPCRICPHLEYCRRMVRTQAPLHRKCEPNQPKSRRVIAELARTPASYRIPEMIVADGCMSVEHTVSAKSTVVTRESAQVEAR